jgi:hypothetical protein
MSLFRNLRPSRRQVLKQTGMLTALSAATPFRPFAAEVEKHPADYGAAAGT